MSQLTKTNYILWRECAKNAWLKIHKPEIYFANPLSSFERQIIELGNEVDEIAQKAFEGGEFQRRFETSDFIAITDIIKRDRENINLFEVKATNEIDKKTHYHDLAFQYNVLKILGYEVLSTNLLHLNKDYIRSGDLVLKELLKTENVTEKIKEISDEVQSEMELALRYLREEKEPVGPCDCLRKGRSSHCTTFYYSNKDVPEYSVHDLARIGLSKRKLTELVDGNNFHIKDIPEHIKLTPIQENQVWTHRHDREIISIDDIREELDHLTFPLYFLDYETFPSAIPRFNGFSPYKQIPFQYSLHILETPGTEPIHKEFLHTENTDPSKSFYESMRDHVGTTGNVIVWHKDFECSRNREIATRLPESSKFFNNINDRIFDLEVIFKKQHYVHKDFRGSSSIKKVLPVLAPDLSYKKLSIQEGGSAAESWNRLVTEDLKPEEKATIAQDLRDYCKLDTYAMYAVWKKLREI